jgi:hypothetical protein
VRLKILVAALVVTVLAAAAVVVLTPGFPFRVSAPAPAPTGPVSADAALWPYACEQHWLGTVIARSIVDLVGTARQGSPASVSDLQVGWQPDSRVAGSFLVGRPGKTLPAVTVTGHLWSVETWTPLATLLLEGVRGVEAASDDSAFLSALANGAPDVLAMHESRLSTLLAEQPRTPALHEQAAFVLAAFAWRESADAFSDVRLSLARLSAHLAVASALRQGSGQRSPAGQLAAAMQSALLGRQIESLRLIDDPSLTGSPAAQPWRQAVRLRNTGDWRALTEPTAGTLVERLEYLRAIVTRRSENRALEFLDTFTPEPVPDWGRILTQGGGNLETGGRFFDGVYAADSDELRAVLTRYKGRLADERITGDPVRLLNEQPAPSPVVTLNGRPGLQIIDWGMWAAFFQRHLASRLVLESDHYRTMLGLHDRERAFNEQAVAQYGGLRLMPLVRRYFTTDPAGYERQMEDASALCVTSPESVTALNWMLLSEKPEGLRLRPGLPSEAAWFAPPQPVGTAFEPQPRLFGPGHSRHPSTSLLDTTAAIAPYDLDLLWVGLIAHRGDPPPLEAREETFAPLLPYDVRAVRLVSGAAEDKPERLEALQRTVCELDVDSCSGLARRLVEMGRPEDAVRVFERWFAKARDRVAVSNGLAWLVTYYRQTGRNGRARILARAAAEVYSYEGLVLLARQNECDGRLEAAEAGYQAAVERYGSSTGLLAFYLRQGRRQPDSPWATRAASLARQVLGAPLALLDEGTLSGPPARGVTVTAVSMIARRAGLAVGDILVGFNGYAVPTYQHYIVAEGLSTSDTVTFVVWRRDHYEHLKHRFPQNFFPITLQTYPPQR